MGHNPAQIQLYWYLIHQRIGAVRVWLNSHIPRKNIAKARSISLRHLNPPICTRNPKLITRVLKSVRCKRDFWNLFYNLAIDKCIGIACRVQILNQQPPHHGRAVVLSFRPYLPSIRLRDLSLNSCRPPANCTVFCTLKATLCAAHHPFLQLWGR